jgi:hypothetical protein
MTTTIRSILIALAFLCQSLIAAPGTPVLESNVDSLNDARALVTRPATHYELYANIETFANNLYTSHQMDATMQPDGSITRLYVDNKQILTESDPPLASLPLPKEGKITYMYVNLNGRADDGEYVSWGYFQAETFKRGDAIAITMYPTTMKGVINFPLPAGLNPEDLEIAVDNGWGMYDRLFGAFVVSYSPQIYQVNYTITNNRTGAVLQKGVFHPFDKPDPNQPASTSSFIGFVYGNGVGDATPGKLTGYLDLSHQELDGQTINPTSGAATPAKVYFANVDPRSNPKVAVDNIRGHVEIYEATKDGTMPLLAQGDTTPSPFDGLYGVNFTLPPGPSKILIKVTGTPGTGGFHVFTSNGGKG